MKPHVATFRVQGYNEHSAYITLDTEATIS
jgi:hypothetical protein